MDKENKKSKLNIYIFIIILLTICIVSIVKILIAPEKDESIVVQAEVYKEEEIILPEDTSISIAVIGDIMCHNTQYKDAYDSNTGEYNFSYVFEDIKGYIESADLAIGNLETTFAGKEIGYSSYPNFNTPEMLAQNLKDLGIDILSTANNHSLDTGYTGIVSTINELDKVGIEHMGTYESEDAAEGILIKEINDIKIAFLSYTYGTNGIPVPSGKEYCINLIEDEKIILDIEKAKGENPDIIIAIMHWGEEYQTKPNDEQKRLMEILFENDVDLIFGSHPHVLQKMEKYSIIHEDGTGKEGFTIFSLGNFMSGQVKEYTKQSIILNLNITKKHDGTISIDNVNYTPIYTYDKNGAKRYKLLDIEKEISIYENGDISIGSSLYNTLKDELDHIYEVVGNEI